MLRSYRHPPLLAQIGFVVVTGFLAIWLGPVGFDRLFPLTADRANHGYRKRLVGLELSLIGWGGAVRKVVGIRRGAISDNMRVSFQAARSIG